MDRLRPELVNSIMWSVSSVETLPEGTRSPTNCICLGPNGWEPKPPFLNKLAFLRRMEMSNLIVILHVNRSCTNICF